MSASLIAVISGYEVETVSAASLRVGDVIYNPYSNTHLDSWTEVTTVRVLDDELIEIGVTQGSDNVNKGRVYNRRTRLAHPNILATMYSRKESLDQVQIDHLQRTGYLALDDKGFLVLTGYAKSEIGEA
ncbi:MULTISPECIES: hypothetical protein [unclassified Xanthomonas]|uniref:hypothetical protein n=1 Tax=unclassified Xanthomonas TaxID=2643310 RepID=UPI002A82171A|nr:MULTISPECIES: hypothetical protein [unclassified Xanthomonas]MDY4297022.1 hypothetical protein [Xanthomonas sp. LF02-5]MDY4359017.1 hypothetical protein [Xanthomonas sp. LF04-12]